MKLKLDWGWGVIFIISGILIFLAALFYFSSKQDFDLVDENYYEKSVKYQSQIEKIKNASELSTPVTYNLTSEGVDFVFPGELKDSKPVGIIHFYSPVKKEFDITEPIAVDSVMHQFVPFSKLKTTRYIAKIEWKSNTREYYQELELKLK